MPPSVADSAAPSPPAGLTLAITAESLFIANLTVAPGAAFLMLFWLWHRHRSDASALARNHLDQAFHVSLRGGAILVTAIAVIIAFGGFGWEWTWVIVVTYFTCIHSTLLVCGCLALAKAMAGHHYRFPIFGVRHE